MTTLTFVMTIVNICDGDKQPSLRHKYTIEDMINFHAISELGINTGQFTFFELKK